MTPTGIFGLDLMLDGGWPIGHISEITGGGRSGKSTLAYCTAAAHQWNTSGNVYWITGKKRSFVEPYALDCGIVMDRIGVIECTTTDQLMNIAADLAESTEGSLLVIDDLSRGASSDEEFNNKAPRLGKTSARELAALAYKNNHTLLVLTDPTIAWTKTHPYWVSRLIQTTDRGSKAIDCYIARNPEGRVGVGLTLPLIPGHGIDHALHLLQLGVAAGIIKEQHAHYTYLTQKLGHGKEEASATLRRDDLLAGTICHRLSEAAWEAALTTTRPKTSEATGLRFSRY